MSGGTITVRLLTPVPALNRIALPPVPPDVTPVYDLLPTIFVAVESLPPLVQPAHLTRDDGITLVWVDPSTLRAEFVFWCREHLSDGERVVVRLAFGGSADLSEPPPDAYLEGTIGEGAPIPAELCVPSEAVSGTRSA